METEQHTAEKTVDDQSHKGRIQKFLESNEKENIPESVGHSRGCAQRKVYTY
jgi:hypothetical protein